MKYMQDIRTHLKQVVLQALGNLALSIPDDIHLEHPANPEHGEWSTNVAMLLYAETKKRSLESGTSDLKFSNPRELAQAVVQEMNAQISSLQSLITKIEVAGPGFINFYLSNEFYVAEMGQLVQRQGKLSSTINTGKRVTTEFTDPNPFKEFHIGHLYSNAVGETFSRLLEATGATVRRVCYQGDVGMHVAKSIWGMQKKMRDDQVDLEHLAELDLTERIKFLGKAYSLGATVYEEDEQAQSEMKAINKDIFAIVHGESAGKEELQELYETGRKWSLEYFETIYQRLGTQFEGYYFESKVGQKGVEIVQEFLKKGVFRESNGAVIFPGSEHGLHDRVFLNSLGLPTYEAKELGLAPTKYQDWQYDESIIITGNEIKEYFKVLLKVMSIVRPELASKTKHFSHGMVRLPEGKMSSRTGKILTGEWLLEEAKTRIQQILEENKPDLSTEKKEQITETLAVAAVKYALLKNGVGGDIKFNFDESVSFEGNSGPYLEYTCTRAMSVLRKSDSVGKTNMFSLSDLPELNADELAVLRWLSRFEETVMQSAAEYAPHQLCTYLFSLAQAFNSLYANHQIIGSESEALRLQITQAVSITLEEGLRLLGIETVEEM